MSLACGRWRVDVVAAGELGGDVGAIMRAVRRCQRTGRRKRPWLLLRGRIPRAGHERASGQATGFRAAAAVVSKVRWERTRSRLMSSTISC